MSQFFGHVQFFSAIFNMNGLFLFRVFCANGPHWYFLALCGFGGIFFPEKRSRLVVFFTFSVSTKSKGSTRQAFVVTVRFCELSPKQLLNIHGILVKGKHGVIMSAFGLYFSATQLGQALSKFFIPS